MLEKTSIERDHPIRKLFRSALDFGLKCNLVETTGVSDYIEEQILCEFINADTLFRIRDESGEQLDDIADMLEEGSVLLNAQSFSREFQVHKHIGDYTLFMLGMFPAALDMKRGKEFVLGRIVVPDSALSEHYVLQGRQSYKIASEFTHSELFLELSGNFVLYKNVLELVRMYLASIKNTEFLKEQDIILGAD